MTPTNVRASWLVTGLLATSGLCASAQSGMTQAKAKELIESGTAISSCGTPVFTFSSVQLGEKTKQRNGDKQITINPVHAKYSVNCHYGPEQMRAEVDLTIYFFLDSFGSWKSMDPGFDGDQSWSNTANDVRCRVQNLAHLTVDKNDNVTGSTPAKDQGFMGCKVVSRAGS